jgi:hypothetical protein
VSDVDQGIEKMKYHILGLCLAVLLLIPSLAMASNPVTLLDGQTIYGYYRYDIPKNIPHTDCERLAFKDEHFTPLADGLYTAQDHDTFLIESGCIYPSTGQSHLMDDTPIYTFESGIMGGDGDFIYKKGPTGFIRLKTGTYTLKSGAKFSVTNGLIDDYGQIQNDQIIFENRD